MLGTSVGAWLKILFFSVAIVSLWAAALGLLDVIGRVGADFVKRNFLQESALLLISTCAASVVTLMYSVLLIRLNSKDVPRPIAIRAGAS